MAYMTWQERVLNLEQDLEKLSQKVDEIVVKNTMYDKFFEFKEAQAEKLKKARGSLKRLKEKLKQ